MVRTTALVGFFVVCASFISGTAASAQVVIYYGGDCDRFAVAYPGELNATRCSSSIIHLVGTRFPFRTFRATILSAWTNPFSCPVNEAFHQSRTWHPSGGVERLSGTSHVYTQYGTIIRRDGSITYNGSLTTVPTPFAPWNCWLQ
jgi:hypothetical protein